MRDIALARDHITARERRIDQRFGHLADFVVTEQPEQIDPAQRVDAARQLARLHRRLMLFIDSGEAHVVLAHRDAHAIAL